MTRSVGDGAHRLPLPLDSFVGRESDTAEVISLARCGRLVTLVGPAGVGKTRLALEAARALAPGCADGALFVALTGTARPELVTQVVASALGVSEQPGLDLPALLVEHLRPRELLLVLDNCEHVAAGVGALVEELLPCCPGLRVLVTSQEALGVAGEQVRALAPLRTPAGLDEVADSPAVRLFCERAAATSPGFALTATNIAAVGDICRRLDGLPLAIELAAVRVAVLSPAEIAGRLGDRFGLLASGSRTAPDRHQSLRAALDWSHDLCSPAEQALLRRLSVFAGGCPLAGATKVCAGHQLGAGEVLDTLAALVAKSLVGADTSGPEARYCMLETVRHYADDRLAEAGEGHAVALRHARWAAAMAEAAEAGLTGPDQQAWLGRLDFEQDNLHAALDWSLSERQHTLSMRLAGPLALWWRLRGAFSEGRAFLEATLSLAESDDVPPGLRAKAAWGAALMAVMVGDTAFAWARAVEALDLYRSRGDSSGWARSLLVMANCQILAGASVAAQPLLEQAVALAREAEDDWCAAHALAMEALSHRNQGKLAAARDLAEDAVAVARRSRDPQGLRIGLSLLGDITLGQGDLDLAEAAFEEALAITADLGETYGTAAALLGLGELWLARGDYERAGRLLDEATGHARMTGTPQMLLEALCLQARLAQSTDDLATAGRFYEEALSAGIESGLKQAGALRGLGEVAAAQGEQDEAARLFDEALATARALEDQREVAALLSDLASLANAGGDYDRAVTLHHEALALRRRIGDDRGLVESLEAVGTLAADAGRRHAVRATRLLGAAHAFRQARKYAPTSAQRRGLEITMARLRQSIEQSALEVAWADGARLSIQQAVSLASKSREGRARPMAGWSSLTTTERTVASFAAGGLSNQEIGEKLGVATGTIKGHLKHVFAKLAVGSRVDLARQWPPEAGQLGG